MNKHSRIIAMIGAVFGALFLFTFPGGAFATNYIFTSIPDPFNGTLSGNGTPLVDGNTYVRGINGNGQIVGFADANNGAHGGFEGFIESPYSSPGNFTGINAPGCCSGGNSDTQLSGINNKGQIVGSASGGNGMAPSSPFLYSGGNYTFIIGGNSTANGINDHGQIVGRAGGPGVPFGGYLYTNGTFTHISDPLAAPRSTIPMGINGNGQIVGVYYGSSGTAHGFYDTNTSHPTFTQINDPLATLGTDPRGINNRGQIVGYYQNASGIHGFIDNNGVFSTINDPLFSSAGTQIYGINNSGQIVGDVGHGSGFIASPSTLESTPEPSAMLLFGTGIFLTGVLALRNPGLSSRGFL